VWILIYCVENSINILIYCSENVFEALHSHTRGVGDETLMQCTHVRLNALFF